MSAPSALLENITGACSLVILVSQMMRAGAPRSATSGFLEESQEELAEIMKHYLAYSGRYKISEGAPQHWVLPWKKVNEDEVST
ncbi:hypothetical protein BBP40_010998 [Aspergillus hancockii]|nr:hypothetical protein BBP40_010998 [Aspergillus hancockii]